MSDNRAARGHTGAPRFQRAAWIKTCVVLVVAVPELSCRLFWQIHGVPFLSASRDVLYYFYPELKEAKKRLHETNEPAFEILMLGGSVLHKDFGNIAGQLLETVTRRTSKRVRIYNLAMPAHTAVDSYYKYGSLSDHRFNLVIVYDGINEVRANNSPDDVFKDDFSHYSWYKRIHLLETGSRSRWFVGPYTAQFAWIRLTEVLGWTAYIPRQKPKDSWLEYGRRVKTAGPFRDYLSRTIGLAAQKKAPVLLMTISFCLPEGDTKERLRRSELWGNPENVMRALSEHNKIIEGIARSNDQVTLVDQNRLIPKEGGYFHDIVHLTPKGSQRFVENIVDVVVSLVNRG